MLTSTRTLIVEVHDRMFAGCSAALYGALLQHSFQQDTRDQNTTVFYLGARRDDDGVRSRYSSLEAAPK
jgi:hypothetical protein